jgi:hypothetical protein
MYIGLSVKCPLFLSDFNGTFVLSTDFQKNAQMSNLTKIQWQPSCSIRKDGHRQTGMTKLIIAFRDFSNASTKAFIPAYCSLRNVDGGMDILKASSSLPLSCTPSPAPTYVNKSKMLVASEGITWLIINDLATRMSNSMAGNCRSTQ